MRAAVDELLFLLIKAFFQCLATSVYGLLVVRCGNGSVSAACNNAAVRESVLNTRIK
jgi:hypothetical protein